MDDAGEDSRTLKALLIEESLPKVVSEQIGRALGEFIVGVHTWNQNPDIDLTGRLESTLTGKDDIPTLSDPLLEIPEAKMATISKLVEKRQQAI